MRGDGEEAQRQALCSIIVAMAIQADTAADRHPQDGGSPQQRAYSVMSHTASHRTVRTVVERRHGTTHSDCITHLTVGEHGDATGARGIW